jgi:hypothetical protein
VDEDRYLLAVPALGTALELDRVHWESNTLSGMLTIRCDLPGAKKVWGNTLSVAEFNISGPNGRKERAKFLAERIQSGEYDWLGLMEELCQRVLADQTAAPPSERLIDIPPSSEANRWYEAGGMKILTEHPTVFFGDGGSAKSYLGLYFAGLIAGTGVNVALFDWEFEGAEHSDRYRRLFGADAPANLRYMRLSAPLHKCQDGLRRFAKEHDIGFAVFDSVGFACGNVPEAAESALTYYAAVRRVCAGSLHVAHRSKSGEQNDRYPFGSIFWHNGCRASWYMEGAEEAPNSPVLNVAMHCRKGNIGGKTSAPLGFTLVFAENATTVRSSDPTENPDLAAKVPLWRRMQALLRHGAMTPEQISERLDVPVKHVQSENNRRKGIFVLVDGKIGLATRREGQNG